MVKIVLNDLLKDLSRGKLTYDQVESAILRYRELEQRAKEALNQINHPEVRKKLTKEIQFRFENGQGFTLEEWNRWREEGWRKVFEELKRRGRQ